MTTITIILAGVLGLTILFLLSAFLHMAKLQRQLELLDREQHIQNEDIYKVMKENYELKGMVLQHIEILKYLVEQDPKMKTHKILFQGPIGEA